MGPPIFSIAPLNGYQYPKRALLKGKTALPIPAKRCRMATLFRRGLSRFGVLILF
jgi:hypothetical protein